MLKVLYSRTAKDTEMKKRLLSHVKKRMYGDKAGQGTTQLCSLWSKLQKDQKSMVSLRECTLQVL